jgi:hypothetical protein
LHLFLTATVSSTRPVMVIVLKPYCCIDASIDPVSNTSETLSALSGTSPPHPAPCFWLDLAKNSGRSFSQSILNLLERA